MYEKDNPLLMMYKYDFLESWQAAIIGHLGHNNKMIENPISVPLKYKGPLPVPRKLKEGLVSLCKGDAIPEDCHHFYHQLIDRVVIEDDDFYSNDDAEDKE